MSALLKRPTLKLINGSNVYHSETYVSNGHWLIRKDRLKPSSLDFIRTHSLYREMPEASMAKVVPADGDAWTVTDIVRKSSHSVSYRLLYSEALAQFAGIDVRYADWLGLTPGTVAYSQDASRAFRTAAGDVVMPLRDIYPPDPPKVSTMHGKSIAELTAR